MNEPDMKSGRPDGRGPHRTSVHDFHSLLTSWITLALAADVPLEMVQRVTDHRTAEVVMKHYFRPGREHWRSLMRWIQRCAFMWSDSPLQYPLQQMAMTAVLILCTVAHHGHGTALGKVLEQPQCEFLAVVLYGTVAPVNRAAFKQLLAVATTELRPGHLIRLPSAKELLAWAKIRHPDMVAVGRHPAATEARRQNPQAIFGWFNAAKQ